MEREVIDQIVERVVRALSQIQACDGGRKIPVGISNRHIHLSAEHMKILFGGEHTLTHKKDLKQIGEFAAEETVTLVGPKGVLRGVRVLGPLRTVTQIELSRTDGFSLGIPVPVRDSGQIEGSPGVVVVGSLGAITLKKGVICAARHIHMHNDDARQFGVADGDRVTVEIDGVRGAAYNNVLVRVDHNFRLELHIDADEANAVNLKNGDEVKLLHCKDACRATPNMSNGTPGPVQNLAAECLKVLVPKVPKPVTLAAGKKKIVDAGAVRAAAANGVKRLVIVPGTIVTPLAWDMARDYSVDIIYS